MKRKKKIVCLTAYSKNFAEIIDKHADIILVSGLLDQFYIIMKQQEK